MQCILGKKIGMTRIFDKDANNVAVTVVKAGPCDVCAIKTKEKDGIDAMQMVFDTKKHTSKSLKGHFKNSKTTQNKHIIDFKINKEEDKKDLKVGAKITAECFQAGDNVKVIGTSKGKGFAGVMKRHGFKGSPGGHGHERPRSAGSIGCRYPQRTIKGKRMPGHMGTDRITVKGLKIVDVDIYNNLLAISGAIPGPKKGLVQIIGVE